MVGPLAVAQSAPPLIHHWACGLTNGHVEICGTSLEDPDVINTESD